MRNALAGGDPEDVELAEDPYMLVDVERRDLETERRKSQWSGPVTLGEPDDGCDFGPPIFDLLPPDLAPS